MLWHNGKAKAAAVTAETFRFFDALIVGVDLTLVRHIIEWESDLEKGRFSFQSSRLSPLIIIINLKFIYVHVHQVLSKQGHS